MKDTVKNIVKKFHKKKSLFFNNDVGKRVNTEKQLGPIYVFIRSWNRSLYLWSCLDSLYRVTKFPCRFVLIDNHSTDPLVRQIVQGFQRRNFFHSIHFMDRNHPSNQTMAYFRYRSEMGKYFVLIDADITIEETTPCWLEQLITIAEKKGDHAIIGSCVDTRDFIDPRIARDLAPEISDHQIDNLIKTGSPERRLSQPSGDVIYPFNPPGRLLLLRTAAIDQIGLQIGNVRLCEAARNAGYRSGIATGVRHRHLSLLNIFDYPDYDFSELRRYLRG